MAAPLLEPKDLPSVLSTLGKTLVMVGSAVSLSSPAGGPSAHGVIRDTVSTLRDLTAIPSLMLRAQTEAALRDPPWELLPESLYAAIAEVQPRGIHEQVWSKLDRDSCVPSSRPNLGHFFTALAAYRTGGLIVTTNFDGFIEEALRDVGISCQVMTGWDLWNGASPDVVGEDFCILKIHGDAGRPHTLVSKAPDLARTYEVLHRLNLGGQITGALVTGYSGRDLDVFPWIASLDSVRRVCWIDREFDREHRSAYLENCVRIRGEAEICARLMLESWSDDGDKLAQAALEQVAKLPPSTGTKLKKSISDAAVEACATVRPDTEIKAALALARAFVDIGRHPIAADLLAHARPSGNASLDAERLLVLSVTHAGQDAYLDSQADAREAASTARRMPDKYARRHLAARARLQAAYARVLYEHLSVPAGRDACTNAGDLARARHLAELRSILGFVSTLLRYLLRGARAIRRSSRATFGETSPAYRLACDYLESAIRLDAFAGRALPVKVHIHLLDYLDRLSFRIGYLAGAVNVSKYWTRLRRPQLRPEMSLRGRLAVLDYATARAINARDSAAQAMSVADADTLSRLADAAACDAGSPSIRLQVAFLRRKLGLPDLIDEAEVEHLAGRIQARRVAFTSIVPALKAGPSTTPQDDSLRINDNDN